MGGIGVKFKITGDETGHAFSIVEHPVQPRTLVPPHLHHDTDEYSYVTEGKFGARIGDQILLANPGDYVLKPRGIPHTFWNPTDKLSRLVEIISPAGFEKFFAEAGLLFQNTVPEFEKVKTLAAKYNTSLGWDEWVPELTKRYTNSSVYETPSRSDRPGRKTLLQVPPGTTAVSRDMEMRTTE